MHHVCHFQLIIIFYINKLNLYGNQYIKKTYRYPMGILRSIGAIHPHQRHHHYHLYFIFFIFFFFIQIWAQGPNP